LLRGYARLPDGARPAVARALAMVEHPATRRLVSELVSGLGPEALAKLERVVARIERRSGR
jgi:ABC-type polar amino acid transport system ATPase subunit